MAQNDSNKVALEEVSKTEAPSIDKDSKKRERFESRWVKNLNRAEAYNEKGYYKTASFMMRLWIKRESKNRANSNLMATSLIAKSKYLEGLGEYDKAEQAFERGVHILDSNRVDPKYRLEALNLASESKQAKGEFYHAYYLSLLAKYEIGKRVSTSMSSEAIEAASYKQDSLQGFASQLEQLENLAVAINKAPASTNYSNASYFKTDYNLLKINQGRGFYTDGINSIDSLLAHVSSTLIVQKDDLKRK